MLRLPLLYALSLVLVACSSPSASPAPVASPPLTETNAPMSPRPTPPGDSKQTAGRQPSDAQERLIMEARTILLEGEIDDDSATVVISKLLFLESRDPTRKIHLHINSPGGSVTAALAIYDTLQSVKVPVSTRCVGQAAAMAAILLAGGARGERESLPGCRMMLLKPVAQSDKDPALVLRELQRMTRTLVEKLAHDTGQSAQQIESDMQSARSLSAQEAREYGLIDRVL